MKEKISQLDHWTDKQETRSAVENLIRDTLPIELPDCYDDMIITACGKETYE